MTLPGYKKKFEDVRSFEETPDLTPKKLNIRNFSRILDIKYPNTFGRLNINITSAIKEENSFHIHMKYGVEELIYNTDVIVYSQPISFILNDFGDIEELYEIATYKNAKPNYSHYFIKSEIDTMEKFCEHLLLCANELIDDLPF